MKHVKWLVLMGATLFGLLSGPAQPMPEQAPPPASGPAASPLSPTTAEVVRLAEAGTGEDVIMAYIQNSQSAFSLSADNLLYLKDVGISSQVTTAMLNRDAALQNQGQNYNYTQQPYPPTAPPPAPVEAPLTPTPEPAAPEPTPAPDYVSAPPPVEVNYFYNDLSPYGAWVQLEGVGWCWQPRAVAINRGWRPYCDGGHWVYSDAGWYWQSDYSWGWAPFHYGRWYMHPRSGWVWTPDTVWGPAWVTWRSAGDSCGWAPLPPRAVFDVGFGWRFNGVRVGLDFDFGLRADHFTFIGVRDFREHDYSHHRLAPTEVTRIYNHTTIINNYTVNNTTIVNKGIPVEHVAEVTHAQIRPVAIREAPASQPGAVRALGNRSPEKTGVVYRPQLKAPPPSARPVVAQKVDERHPVIQHAAVPQVRQPQSFTAPQRTVRPPNTPQTVPVAPRSPAEAQRMAPRPAPEKAPAYPQAPTTPRTFQQQPYPPSSSFGNAPHPAIEPKTAPHTPVPPPTHQPAQSAPLVPKAQPAPEPKQTHQPQTYNSAPGRPESSSAPYSTHSTPPVQSRQGVVTAPGQNSHTAPPPRPSESLAPPSAPRTTPPVQSHEAFSIAPSQGSRTYSAPKPTTHQGGEMHFTQPSKNQSPPSSANSSGSQSNKKNEP